MTMRAYKVKKCGSRKSVSNSQRSDVSSSRVNEELNPEIQDERNSNSNARDINSSLQNSEKIQHHLMDTVTMTAQHSKVEELLRATSKSQLRRVPSGAALGINHLKFPPGFFSELEGKKRR
jgi:CHAT domain-containing protein